MSFRIVPVIDLRAGKAVHARGGRRERYEPVRSVLVEGADPLDLARAYRDALGAEEVYVADLDAIQGGPVNLHYLRGASGLGLRLWFDAGIADARGVRMLRDAGADVVILASETLPGPAALAGMVGSVGAGSIVFSLDLNAGRPIVPAGAPWPSIEPLNMVSEAHAAGVRSVLVLDLARVGSGGGVSALPMAAQVMQRHPGIEVAVGGGVSGPDDLERARRAGVRAVLVGTALHDGRIERSDLPQRSGRSDGSQSRSTSAD